MNQHLHTPVAATFSKDPDFWGEEIPAPVLKGEGAFLTPDLKTYYLDWVCGLGANLLGHGEPGFVHAIHEGVRSGIAFSLPSYYEEEVAALICAKIGSEIPGFEERGLQVRFGATGSDICNAAVRLARAATGKNLVLSYGYHGWGSEFVCATEPAWGCVPQSQYLPGISWNNLRSLERVSDGHEIAAVIVEQGIEEPNAEWYPGLRKFCDQHHALLILDEVVTGLRFGLGGAASRYGVYPDIVCLGKALGNGLPISALLAPKELMAWFGRNDPVFALSSTTNANNVCLLGAKYILDSWTNRKAQHLSRLGSKLYAGLEAQGWQVQGQPERFIIRWASDEEHAVFVNEMRKRNILANRPFFNTSSHKEIDVAVTLDAAKEIRQLLDTGKAEIPELPRVLFRNR